MSAQSLQIREEGESLLIRPVNCFSLADTLDCGQCFRFSPLPDGGWEGIAYGRLLRLRLEGDCLILYHTTRAEFETVWRQYFDLDRDYTAVLAAMEQHPVLQKAGRYAAGIRLLHQDLWETLCSFILSQNNNIPRIKGIIARLCETFGDPVEGGYAFPTAARLAPLSLEALAPLRSGFRAKYILDAARKVTDGTVDLSACESLPLQKAREMLMQINGVGPKVADCALLFGAGRIECFPEDIWIKRVMRELFGGRLPDCAVPYAGIVQQYLFHYARVGGGISGKA
ncbi:MAG: DNA-3-methyladenine glycosylase family protein [Candidatus Howiella sp.]|jgi:N-glycosylase/DNA lyase